MDIDKRNAKRIPLFDAGNMIFLTLLAAVMAYPLWYELSISLSSMKAVAIGGLYWGPRDVTLGAYKQILGSAFIWSSLRNSIMVAAIGTVLSIMVTAMTAYPLIKRQMPGQKPILLIILFTMLFSGGLIPRYLLVKELGLINSLAALILPVMVSAYNVFIMRSFFASLPAELEESATVDGANPLRIFFTIILPLSLPVLATIGLWEAVGYWNNYFDALIYLNKTHLFTMPLLIKTIIEGQAEAQLSGQLLETTRESVIAATIFVSLIPILCVYPFLQKYFVKGTMIGAIKS